MIDRDLIHRAFRAALDVRAQPGNGSAGPPWDIVDTSTAEPEINWPGEFLEEVTNAGQVGKRLMHHRLNCMMQVIETALAKPMLDEGDLWRKAVEAKQSQTVSNQLFITRWRWRSINRPDALWSPWQDGMPSAKSVGYQYEVQTLHTPNGMLHNNAELRSAVLAEVAEDLARCLKQPSSQGLESLVRTFKYRSEMYREAAQQIADRLKG